MKHPDDGTLMAYRDRELSVEVRQSVQAHLSTCARCRARLSTIEDSADRITSMLSVLAPQSQEARRALSDLRQTLHRRKNQTMLERIKLNKRALRWAAGFAALVVIVGLFSLAPVRALASEFLSLFRVEKFVAVDVDPDRLDQIAQVLDENASFGEFAAQGEEAEPTEVGSLEEAASLAGFTPGVPEGYGAPSTVSVTSANTTTFTPDVESMREVFSALDLDPALIPDSIDGQTFTFSVPAGVVQIYDDEDGEELFALMQSPGPTIDGPADADLQQLGNAMLRLLGMSEEEAAHMSESIDWTSTLVVPVPTDVASVREVEVNGASGLLFNEQSSQDDGEYHPGGSVLVWQANGYVYGVASDQLDDAELTGLAGSVQ